MRNKLNNKTATKCQRTSPNQRAFISHLDAPNQQVVACYLFESLVAGPSNFEGTTPAKTDGILNFNKAMLDSTLLDGAVHFQFLTIFSINVGSEQPAIRLSIRPGGMR
jgi:hypothetical protein